MRLINASHTLPLARILALVALLCTSALQAQEAGHGHWDGIDDSYSQCLVYKSSGPAALATEPTLPALPTAECHTADPRTGELCPSQSGPFQARGPPSYS